MLFTCAETVMLGGIKCAKASDLNLSPCAAPGFFSSFPMKTDAYQYQLPAFFLILFPFPPDTFTDLRCPLQHFKSFHYCFQLCYLACSLRHNYILLKVTLRRNPQHIVIISSLRRKVQKYCS